MSSLLRSLIIKPYLICPTCGSDDVMKNGMTRRGKQNHKCRECGRQFVENPNLDTQRHRHFGKN
jgi:transposase-like protein